MSHRTLVTSASHVVGHHHHASDYTPAQKASMQASYLADPDYPGIQPVYYVHLNGVHEELLPTNRYNCWGFTFNPRQCAINTGSDVQTVLTDNGVQVYPPNLRVGDVICYRDGGVITHTGRIVAVNASGQPSTIQSKWGDLGEYYHAPHVVPGIYGTDRTFWRVTPLGGKGDAWAMDNAADDRLPCPPGTLCQSPDLWLNNHGGTYHEDAVGGSPNSIYVRVHNPDTLPIVNAQIHVYWSDPATGMPHDGWHPIGTSSVSVPAGGEQIAPPVAWTPDASVPPHACLFAILDTGDDPFAAATLDPIVWPYDWAFDNNVVWHNLEVVWLMLHGRPVRLHFVARNPLPFEAPVELRGSLEAIGPKDIRAMNLDPEIAARVIEPPKAKAGVARSAVEGPGLKVSPGPFPKGWRAGGDVASPKGWRLRAPKTWPGRGGRVILEVAANRYARPGQAYRLYFEQKVGGRPTGAVAFVLVVKD